MALEFLVQKSRDKEGAISVLTRLEKDEIQIHLIKERIIIKLCPYFC